MKQSKLLLALGFAAFAFLGLSIVASPNAKAALDGTNDPILFVDQNQCIDSCDESQPTSNVVTTTPTGGDEIVAAASNTYVSAATISGPTATGGHDIVYSSDAATCNEPVILDKITTFDSTLCDYGNVTQAQINKVTIDAGRNPVGDPAVLVTLPTLVDSSSSVDTVYNLSYAPDGKSVLASRNSIADYDGYTQYLATLEQIDTTTGDVTTIVDPVCDVLLRGGFGANGNIYFSKSTYDAECCIDEELSGSNIWYIAAGTTEAVQLTYDQEDSYNVAEYYIDASPDNAQLLVVDANTCSYPYNVIYGMTYLPEGSCAYYYVNIADGSLTPIPEINELFVPKFFSPDGLSLLGTLYPMQQYSLFRSLDVNAPSTAIALRTDLANPVAITNLVGVQEWAPGVAIAPTTTPVAVVTSTGATLPNTGASTTFAFAFTLSLVALGAAALAISARRQ